MRFTLIGTASTEYVVEADTPEAAAQAWGQFQREHQRARRGNMTLRLLFDPPIILDADGNQCEVENVTSKRNKLCRVSTAAS